MSNVRSIPYIYIFDTAVIMSRCNIHMNNEVVYYVSLVVHSWFIDFLAA